MTNPPNEEKKLTKEEEIYLDEIRPLLQGMLAGSGMALAHKYGFEYTYCKIPEQLEVEIQRSIAKIARAYYKSKSKKPNT